MTEPANTGLSMARVAEVIHASQVVINKGAVDGIRLGQTFLIFGLGGTILDPETEEELGVLEMLRGTGVVIHVQNRIAIVRSTNRKIRSDSVGGVSMNALMGVPIGGRLAPTYDDLPFDGAQTGDYARPI